MVLEQMREISPAEYKHLREIIPIACVDVLPIRWVSDGSKQRLEIGLILRKEPDRDTPGSRDAWGVVGGRQYIDETIPEAILRQLDKTLGSVPKGPIPQEPISVVEYLPVPRKVGEPFDPRQHAIGPLYVVEIEREESDHEPLPEGSEASEFRWFPSDDLPKPSEVGFGLWGTLTRCVGRILGQFEPP